MNDSAATIQLLARTSTRSAFSVHSCILSLIMIGFEALIDPSLQGTS